MNFSSGSMKLSLFFVLLLSLFLNHNYFIMSNFSEICTFGKILSYKSVLVFVGTFFPRMIMMHKINIYAMDFSNIFVFCKNRLNITISPHNFMLYNICFGFFFLDIFTQQSILGCISESVNICTCCKLSWLKRYLPLPLQCRHHGI